MAVSNSQTPCLKSITTSYFSEKNSLRVTTLYHHSKVVASKQVHSSCFVLWFLEKLEDSPE